MIRKHHTKRLLVARRKAIKKWIKGLKKAGLPCIISNSDGIKVVRNLTDNEKASFATGFNVGYKIGYEHALHPNKQQSKWKPVLDALCRFENPISWNRALKLLGCTEKALDKHLDKYEYIPKYKDYCYVHRRDILDDLDNLRF